MNRCHPLLTVLCVLGAFVAQAPAGDWLHWRGPEQDGVSREKDLPSDWKLDPKAAGSNLLWKVALPCRTTPLVQGDHVYLINSVGAEASEGERVMCLDANTGNTVWEHRFNVFFSDIVSSRVGWTNLAGDPETGNIYAHGTQGFLFCFSKEGKLLWAHSLTEEYGRISGYGGRLASPIVDGDLVIVGMVHSSWGDYARGANRFVAFNKKDGSVVWWSDPCGQIKGTYYSNPVVAVINGQRLLITGGADGALHAVKVRTGEKVWSYAFGANVINASPVVQGTRVYCGHGEENLDTNIQGRIVCVDAGKVKDGKPALVWEVKGIKAGYTSPIIDGTNVYFCDDSATLFCFEAESGKQLWKHKYGRLARGSGVLADGKIYIAEVNAKFHILQPGAKDCKTLHSQFFPGQGGGFVETNGTPAIVNGRIYFGTRDEFYCIGKPKHAAKAEATPAQPAEAVVKPDATPAAIQVVPADVVLRPGENVTFKVRAFDASGQFLKEVPATAWSLPTPPVPPGAKAGPPLRGEVTEGKLTVANDVPFQQGYVLAKVGDLAARVRVRVASNLPNKFDFTKLPVGAAPSGWVNVQGKYVTEKLPDGTVVLKKLASDSRPPLARANAYINVPTLTDYTIQADLLGKLANQNLPDMGIVANRYTLMLDGNKQQLRIVSWEALPRVDKTIPWKWQENVWYRLKLTVEVQKDKAVVRGKAWPRDKEEPKAWTIEYTDATPNTEGAPALYGYATGILGNLPGAEIYYNNVSVTPNTK